MDHDVAKLRVAVGVITQILAGRGLRVTQQGTQAFVALDPKTNRPNRINLPFLPDDAPVQLVQAIQGFIDHEVAHCLVTDWEVVRAATGEGLSALHNLIEDTFIERTMPQRYPGSAWNLERLHDFFAANITPRLLAEAEDDELRRFGVLFVPAARAMAGQPRFEAFMDQGSHWGSARMQGLLAGLGPDAVSRMRRLSSSSECLDMARLWAKALGPLGASPTGAEPAGEEDGAEGPSGGDEGDPAQENGATPSDPARSLEGGLGARPAARARAPQGQSTPAGDAGAHASGPVDALRVPRGRPVAFTHGGKPGLRGSVSSRREPDWIGGDPFQHGLTKAIDAEANQAMKQAAYRILTRDFDRF